jgi:N-acetylglucosaminyl-diphospho-decaprenol L-rhamnosyltransferase
MTPEVSVLIVGYDDGKLLRKNLPIVQAIMTQSKHTFEIVGVDNGSHDDTIDVLRNYSNKVLSRQQNDFYVPAFIDGLQACEGEFIFVTCPDITWTPKVVKLIDYCIAHPNSLVAPFYRNLNGSPQFKLHNRKIDMTRVFFQMTPFGYFLDQHIAGFGIHRRNQYRDFLPQGPFLVDWTGGMFVVSSKTLNQVGGPDQNMSLCYHDADLCDRLRSIGVRCIVIPDAIVFHVLQGTTRHDPRTSNQAARDFRVFINKWWGVKRFLVWPLLLIGAIFSVPVVEIVRKRLPDRNLLTLRVG